MSNPTTTKASELFEDDETADDYVEVTKPTDEEVAEHEYHHHEPEHEEHSHHHHQKPVVEVTFSHLKIQHTPAPRAEGGIWRRSGWREGSFVRSAVLFLFLVGVGQNVHGGPLRHIVLISAFHVICLFIADLQGCRGRRGGGGRRAVQPAEPELQGEQQGVAPYADHAQQGQAL